MEGDAYLYCQSLVNGIMTGCMLGLIAVGLTLITGVVKVINFAHGDFLMVGMYITFSLFTVFELDPYLSALITIPALFLIGVILFRFFVKPMLGADEFTHVLITFGLALVIRNVCMMIYDPDIRVAYEPYMLQPLFTADNIIFSVSRVAPCGVAIVVIAFVYWVLHRTDLGRCIRATAEDYQAAALLGINPNRVYMVAIGLGCACLGAAAPFLLPIYYVYPEVGMYFTLLSFLIMIMGGTGNIAGALLGGLIVGIIQAMGGVLLSGSEANLLLFVIFMLVLLFRPQGILARRSG